MTNDDNWVICGGGSPHMRVTLLVVYKSCSLSLPLHQPLALISLDQIFIPPPPSLPHPTTLFMKTEQYRNENDKIEVFSGRLECLL